MPRKNFVLDTNILIHYPLAIHEFADNRVIISIRVIEELDRVKSYHDERARSAREATRDLDRFRGGGRLSRGTPLPNGGSLQIVFPPKEYHVPGLAGTTDNDIILTALEIQEEQARLPEEKREKVIFVSKDLNARIKADSLGIETMDFEKQKVSIEGLYSGWAEVQVSAEALNRFYREKGLDLPDADYYPNQFLTLVDELSSTHTALARYHRESRRAVPLLYAEQRIWGIRALNREQRFAMEALMDDQIALVALVGQAGTGKTLLALAAALNRTVDDHTYKRILVSRPVMPLGKDIGFLPGTKDEKLHFWMQPIFDNLEFIMSESGDGGGSNSGESANYLMDRNLLEMEALTYIRGRSISHQYFIVDEAQNLTPHEIKTIISRAGVGTKIIMTGDPYQIDNAYLDANSNGLTYSVEKLKNSPLFASVTLTKSERSELASLAAENL